MAQKIMIALDESENALRAVNYVASTFTTDTDVTLFNVLLDTAAICKMNSPELTPYFKSRQDSFCALEDKKKELVGEALDKAVDKFKDAGFDEDRIHVKTQTKTYGVAKDIILEARDGYDLIVLGRHGTSGIKDFVFGSICQKVFNSLKDISVLIVT
ncbi:MAG: universal stress protein [Desulfobacteraceae bacterium]|nr:universal stress protein [Desulfobacteraceae bacterium]